MNTEHLIEEENSNNSGVFDIPDQETYAKEYLERFRAYTNKYNLDLESKLKVSFYNFKERKFQTKIYKFKDILFGLFEKKFGKTIFVTNEIVESVISYIIRNFEQNSIKLINAKINNLSKYDVIRKIMNGAKIDKENPESFLEDPDIPVFEDIEFEVTPDSFILDEGQEMEFTIIGDIDLFSARSLDETVFIIQDNKIIGKLKGSTNLEILVQKLNKNDTIKSFPVQVIGDTILSSDIDKIDQYLNVPELRITLTTDALEYTIDTPQNDFYDYSKENNIIILTLKSAGSQDLIIRATAPNSREKSITIPVTLKALNITELSINKENITIYRNQSDTLEITSNDPNFIFENDSNISIQKENNTLKITGVTPGETKLVIKAQVENGTLVTKEIPIVIKERIETTLEVQPQSGEIYRDEELVLNITSNDPNYSYDEVEGLNIQKIDNSLRITSNLANTYNLTIRAQVENGTLVTKEIPIVIKELLTTILSCTKENESVYIDEELVVNIETNASDFQYEEVEGLNIVKEPNKLKISSSTPNTYNLNIMANVEHGVQEIQTVQIIIKERIETTLEVQPQSGEIYRDEELVLNITSNDPNYSYDEVEGLNIQKIDNSLRITSNLANTYNLTIRAQVENGTLVTKEIPIVIKELEETQLSIEPQTISSAILYKQINLEVLTNAESYEAYSENNKFSIIKSENNLTLSMNGLGNDKLVLRATAPHSTEKILEIPINIIEDFYLNIEDVNFEEILDITKTENRKIVIDSNSKSPITVTKISGNITIDDSILSTEKSFFVLGNEVGEASLEIKTTSFVDNSEVIKTLNINVGAQPATFVMGYLAMGLATELNYTKQIGILFNGSKEELEVTFNGCTGEVVEVSDFPEYTESVSGVDEFIKLMCVMTGEDENGSTVSQGKVMLEQNKVKPYLVKLKITSIDEGVSSNSRTVSFGGTANSIYALGPVTPMPFQVNIYTPEIIQSMNSNIITNMDRNAQGCLLEGVQNPIALILPSNNEDIEFTSDKPDTTTIEWMPGSLFYGLNIYSVSIDETDKESRTLSVKITTYNNSTEINKSVTLLIRERVKLVFHKESGEQDVLQANIPNKFIIDEFTGDNITRNSLSGSAMDVDFSNVILELSPDKSYFTLQINTSTPIDMQGAVGGQASKSDGSLAPLEWSVSFNKIIL